MPAEDASNKPKPKQNGWRALLRARRRREKREKRQEMMINHKPSLFRWPTRALPAVAGCRTEPHKPCCVSCDQNVGSHLVLDLGARLLATRSAFQAIEVFDTEAFGHVMTIDGDLQITEMDECHYHEMMVHVPLASRPPGAGACVEINFTARSLNRRVVLHAIDATPARWRGDVGSSPCTRQSG